MAVTCVAWVVSASLLPRFTSTGACACGSRFFAHRGVVVFPLGDGAVIGVEGEAVGSLYTCFVAHVGFAETADVVAVGVSVDSGTAWAGSACFTSTSTSSRSLVFLFIAHFGTGQPVVGEDWDSLGMAKVAGATVVDVLAWDG